MSTLQLLQTVLKAHDRIAIVGAPGTGKTTLCSYVTDRPVVHADDHIKLGWSAASEALAQQVNNMPGRVCVEGVAVPRALRKGLRVDAVIVLRTPYKSLNVGQQAMGKGVHTVLDEWRAAHAHVPVYES